MTRQLTDDERRKLTARFEAAGVSAVQIAVASPASNALFGIGDRALATRSLAEEWLLNASERERRRKLRNEIVLWVGSVAATAAALFSALAYLS
jgi:hypothetical protein